MIRTREDISAGIDKQTPATDPAIAAEAAEATHGHEDGEEVTM